MDAGRAEEGKVKQRSEEPPAAEDEDARLAVEVGRAMWAEDRASQALGMELLEVRPGAARIRMRIRADMTNGHGICHGGYMFLLADSTFAFACNSRNQRTVAASAEIHFLAPAAEGDVLTAEGVEQHLAGRSGVYDIRVTDQNDRLVALFRGKSASIKGRFVEPETYEHTPTQTQEENQR